MFLQTPGTSDININGCGLTNGHAYVVLAAQELSNGARVVKVRNPWGSERYKCDYNDDSSLWTPELREEAGATAESVNEGIFFMTISDYHEQGVSTVISYDTSDWYNSHFLMLNDQTDSPGTWSWCGATCTRHTLDVTSEVDQNVYVTAHTWESRTQPIECKEENKIHSLYRDGDFRVAMFKDGAYQIDPI